jgi:hypothetical protein
MNDAETILVLITCLVGITCVIAVQNRQGVILGSVSSGLKAANKKYVERSGKRNQYYLLLAIALVSILLVGLLLTRDIQLLTIFTVLNLFSIGYFLCYFVLLEPKDKSE